MKAEAMTPRTLFEASVHYEIPAFQRPYVWSEEDQWAPLWQDVRRVAEAVVKGGDGGEAESATHFLGAVVFKSQPTGAGDVTRHEVIDGQQRTTTLQVLLDAAHACVEKAESLDDAEVLEELIVNRANRFKGKPERFKLWPSRHDRDAFVSAMDGSETFEGEHRIVDAHRFFTKEIQDWISGSTSDGDEAPPGDEEARMHALTEVLLNRLYMVAIDLGGHDDDQLIFETLNDRGTPLLKADLIKNWVFQRGVVVGADVDEWAETYWSDFDDDWWRQEISQGRLMRSRVDIFLQYWLTMRKREEVITDSVFRNFMQYATPSMKTIESAKGFLEELRRDADTFRSFAQLSADSPQGRFYNRVVESLELASTTPLLLWMVSDNHLVPPDQVEKGLAALESWVIRRTLLRYTMKDVNKLMVAILNTLAEVEVAQAGDRITSFLSAQTADARVWPSDAEVISKLPGTRLYGNVRQARLRVVLEAIESVLRSDKHEDVAVPGGLEIEHVMPRGWRHHWNEPKLGPEEAAERDGLINTLGNLTLLTKKLNGSLSHRPWTDEEAAVVAPKGEEAGKGKRSLINKFSLLVLSKELVDGSPTSWTEDDIKARGKRLASMLTRVWPGPAAVTEASPVEAEPESGQDGSVEQASHWSGQDVELAELWWARIPETARNLVRAVMSASPDRVSAFELADDASIASSVSGVAGVLSWPGRYAAELGRHLPVRWAESTAGESSHYWMESEVAGLFRAVSERSAT